MAKVAPFHSKQHPGKYHVCSNCTEGDNIQPEYKTPGTGGGALCVNCRDLQTQGKC
jgi:hypothetical protein